MELKKTHTHIPTAECTELVLGRGVNKNKGEKWRADRVIYNIVNLQHHAIAGQGDLSSRTYSNHVQCPLLVFVWQNEFWSSSFLSSMLIDDDNITNFAHLLKSVSRLVLFLCMYRYYGAFRFARFYENRVNHEKHNNSPNPQTVSENVGVQMSNGMLTVGVCDTATCWCARRPYTGIIRFSMLTVRRLSRAVWRLKLENQIRGVRRVRVLRPFLIGCVLRPGKRRWGQPTAGVQGRFLLLYWKAWRSQVWSVKGFLGNAFSRFAASNRNKCRFPK